MKKTVELIYITYNRLHYTQMTLPTILSNAGYPFKLTIVDNNSTDGTKEYLKKYENHPSIKKIIYNKKNDGLSNPTNNFWTAATSDYVGKVDNDTIPPDNWLKILVDVYDRNSHIRLGALGGMPFQKDDFSEEKTLKRFLVGNEIVKQHHIGGCCYIISLDVIKQAGKMSLNNIGVDTDKAKVFGWSSYQALLTNKKYINGYIYPSMYVDHMDDPRSLNFDSSDLNFKHLQKVNEERGLSLTKENYKKELEIWYKACCKTVLET